VPSDKRLRQRATKQARMVELRQAQQRRRRWRVAAVGAAIVVVFAILAVLTGTGAFSGSSKKHSTSASTTTPASKTPSSVPLLNAPAGVGCPNLNGSSPHYTHFTAAPPTCIDPSKTYTASVQTDVGTFAIALNAKAAPKTVNNFVFLSGYHFYDGTIFHRVIPGFMNQGGDPQGTGTGGPGYQFADELPSSASQYVAGSVAMANSGPNTNGSQFFVIVGSGGSQLQPSYSLFGQVTSGMDVVTKINQDGNSNPSANGTPPKVTHHIVKVTISQS
jgi:cyclophilin family peptidyl-prolyl cis-trans isomerase